MAGLVPIGAKLTSDVAARFSPPPCGRARGALLGWDRAADAGTCHTARPPIPTLRQPKPAYTRVSAHQHNMLRDNDLAWRYEGKPDHDNVDRSLPTAAGIRASVWKPAQISLGVRR